MGRKVRRRPRKPKEKSLWKLVKGKLEDLKQVWPDRFEKRYGIWRPHAEKQLLNFIRCHDPKAGFARIECPDCDHKILRPCGQQCGLAGV